MKSNTHSKGQYFTIDKSLQECVYKFILNKPKLILEPSAGRGDLVEYINSKFKVKWDLFEIDYTIKFLNPLLKVNYTDFLQHNITKKYVTIIGNPPYVKTKKENLYIKFISKCYDLLDENGELVFIIPSDFFKLTSAKSLINKMF